MDNKNEKAAIFFVRTMTAEGITYEGGKTYLLVKTAGTVDRWLKRGCEMGDPKDALHDPRFKVEKKEEKEVGEVLKPSRSRKSKNKVVEKPELEENKE